MTGRIGNTRADFPADFLFGAATSAYQIEGHAFGGAGPCQWDSFAATPGNVVRGEDGARACDHYHRYPEDLDLVKEGGFDCYRFSTSWARILPDGRGTPNAAGLDFYDRLTDALLERGLKPCVTLYHWELPSALRDMGGWQNRDIAGWFADFAQIVMGRIGDRMYSAATINEPWCIAWLGHFSGDHAPGLRDIRATARALHHVLLAHGRAVETMRAMGIGNLGAVCNFEHVLPAGPTDADAAAADRYDAIFNRFFLSGMFHRRYPDQVLAGIGPYLPRGWQDDFVTIGAPVDWVGLNYYTCKRIAQAPGPWPALTEVPGALPKTAMGWEIHPEGLRYFLNRVRDEFTGDLPLFVTENGMAGDDAIRAGRVDDAARVAYLDAHLGAVRQAIAQGVPVRGYFVWSLLDNYEWALGYDKRFGLVHVDFETLQRVPKASYHALKQALQRSAAQDVKVT
ncbi:GH1 family beta-glucosidase [Brevirhabdus sp.]|uniref:GH1 family beta-glucosidase n=1 Tax=Brevirhabdus sp. TaxID=2004514 RepID=UPI0040587292